MNKKILAGLALGLSIFCVAGLANAISFTQEFYVQVDSIKFELSYHDPGIPDFGDYFNEQEAKTAYRAQGGPLIGSRFYGSVIYDNSNIPKTGNYIIGLSTNFQEAPGWNELQEYVLNWNGILSNKVFISGFPSDRLYFQDGKLSGIDAASLRGPCCEEGFNKNSYWASKVFGYASPNINESAFAVAGIAGTLHIVTPEPSTLLLLGSGLVGLIGFTRKFRKN